jgi:hypothetical protein
MQRYIFLVLEANSSYNQKDVFPDRSTRASKTLPSTIMSTRSLRTYCLVALLALISLKTYTYASNVENMDNLRSLVVSVSYNRRALQCYTCHTI